MVRPGKEAPSNPRIFARSRARSSVACRHRSASPAACGGARLQGVEEREADRLLKLGVSLQLHVGTIPEVIEVVALGGEDPLPAASAGCGEGRLDLVAHRWHGAPARPAVPQELHQSKTLPRL